MRLYALALAIILVLAISLSIADTLAQQSAFRVVIDRARDGIYLDIEGQAVLKGKEPTGIKGIATGSIDTSYLVEEKIYRFIGNVKIDLTRVEAKEKEGYGPKGRMEIALSISWSLEGTKGFATLGGYVKLNESAIPIEGRVDIVRGDKVDSYTVNASIGIPMKLLPKEFLQQLVFIEMFMRPEIMNQQLAQSNATWMKFRELRISHRAVGDTLYIYIYAIVEIDEEERVERIAKGMPSDMAKVYVELSKKLRDLEKKLVREGVAKLYIAVDSSKGLLRVAIAFKGSIKGDVEEYVRLSSRYARGFVIYAMTFGQPTMYIPFAKPSPTPTLNISKRIPSETLEYLKPWLSIVMLPDNTSLRFSLDIEKNSVTLNLLLKKLRLGHCDLRGDEATHEVAKLIVSLLEGIRAAGVPIEYECRISGIEKPKELVESSAKATSTIMESLGIEAVALAVPTISPVPTGTPPLAKTVTIILKQVSTVKEIHSFTTTVVKTVYRTLTKTLTKTETTTLTLLKTVTSPVETLGMTTVAIAIVVAIVASGTTYLLLRKK